MKKRYEIYAPYNGEGIRELIEEEVVLTPEQVRNYKAEGYLPVLIDGR